MLDVDRAAGGNQLEGDPVNASIATNFSNATATGDPKTATSGEMEAFSTDSPSTDKGSINLHNNSDVPRDRNDFLQGTLPDTDLTGMPSDPETNLPN